MLSFSHRNEKDILTKKVVQMRSCAQERLSECIILIAMLSLLTLALLVGVNSAAGFPTGVTSLVRALSSSLLE